MCICMRVNAFLWRAGGAGVLAADGGDARGAVRSRASAYVSTISFGAQEEQAFWLLTGETPEALCAVCVCTRVNALLRRAGGQAVWLLRGQLPEAL